MQQKQEESRVYFSDARWALFWSADVLRRRYLPKIGAFWRETAALLTEGGEIDLTALGEGMKKRWRESEHNCLPTDNEGRHALALKVESVLKSLGEGEREHGRLLRQMAWGDGWSEASWRAALAHRELARRQGMNIRLNYRYTYRQLAVMHDCDAKTVWRRMRAALTAFAMAMEKAGLLWESRENLRTEKSADVKEQERTFNNS